MMGTEYERKKELAMFLGHTLHESDQWRAAREYLICADTMETEEGETYCKPCTADEFNWETFKCEGVGLAGGGLTFNGYCDYTIEPPLACPCEEIAPGDSPYEGYIPASKVFFGRGAVSLAFSACVSDFSSSPSNTAFILLHNRFNFHGIIISDRRLMP